MFGTYYASAFTQYSTLNVQFREGAVIVDGSEFINEIASASCTEQKHHWKEWEMSVNYLFVRLPSDIVKQEC